MSWNEPRNASEKPDRIWDWVVPDDDGVAHEELSAFVMRTARECDPLWSALLRLWRASTAPTPEAALVGFMNATAGRSARDALPLLRAEQAAHEAYRAAIRDDDGPSGDLTPYIKAIGSGAEFLTEPWYKQALADAQAMTKNCVLPCWGIKTWDQGTEKESSQSFNYFPGESKNGFICDCLGKCLSIDVSAFFGKSSLAALDCGPLACGYFCHTYGVKSGKCFKSENTKHMDVCDCRGQCLIHAVRHFECKPNQNTEQPGTTCPSNAQSFTSDLVYPNAVLYNICQGLTPWCALGAYLGHAEPKRISWLFSAFHMFLWQKLYFDEHALGPPMVEIVGGADVTGAQQNSVVIAQYDTLVKTSFDFSNMGGDPDLAPVTTIPRGWYGLDATTAGMVVFFILTLALLSRALPISRGDTLCDDGSVDDAFPQEQVKFYWPFVYTDGNPLPTSNVELGFVKTTGGVWW